MASNFIPMLSSSPPPLDDCQDNEDEDEEFGTFTSANIAFDSSFDSPVVGEKYKSFMKSGNNGVNDLNAFSSSKQSITLNFSKQIPTTHLDSHSTDQNEESHKCISNLVNKGSNDCISSTEELNTKNKGCFETSQNTVPVVVDDCECNVFKENDRSKRKQFSFHPDMDVESNSVYSDTDSCDPEVLDSSFVPPSDDFKMTQTSEDSYIPGEDVGDGFQSTDVVVPKCDVSLNYSADCNEKESDCFVLQNNIKQDESNSEPLESEFQADFTGDSFEADFDVFQGVNSTVNDKTTVLFNGSLDKKESFEAHFDDFQPFENDQDNDFADFKASEESPSDVAFESHEKEEIPEFRGEFTDFKVNDEHSDFDEFDDFQSFDKPNVSSQAEIETSRVSFNPLDDKQSLNDFEQVSNQDEFDEFDDFQACSEVGVPVEQEFASFTTAPFKDKAESDSPEFANFERASFSSASGETYPNSPCLSSSSHNQDKNADKLSTVINAIFPPQEEPSDVEVSYDSELEVVDQSIKSRRLWEKLNEAEQTPGLKFQWGVSNSFQQLLRSVNVDYHSILRTSSVPIFASGLSLLEPVKGQTSSANSELEDKVIPSPRDSIPPVEFDWNSSGLVNPLDTGQSSSILMDLSFLSSTNTASSSISAEDHSFENELLKPSPISAFPESNKTFILEELLSKNICSIPNSNVTHRPPNLSEEANSVLDQLPDLSYMRAKVLMFPISGKT